MIPAVCNSGKTLWVTPLVLCNFYSSQALWWWWIGVTNRSSPATNPHAELFPAPIALSVQTNGVIPSSFFFCLFVKWNYDAIDATSIWEKVVQQEGNDGSSFHLPFWCRLPVGWSGQCATPQLRTPFLCPVGRERKKKRKFLNCYKSVTLGPKRLWIRIDNADTLVFWRRRVCIVVQHVYLHQSW